MQQIVGWPSTGDKTYDGHPMCEERPASSKANKPSRACSMPLYRKGHGPCEEATAVDHSDEEAGE